jgi:RimJ/RimL family protein N-acetyltransferase
MFLRPVEPADVPTFVGWGTDRRFCEHAGWTVDLAAAAHEAHWIRIINDPHPVVLRRAAVVGTEVVGYVDLAGTEPDRRELGYAIGPSNRWGRGLGRLAARLGLDWGFNELTLAEITAEAVDANHASIRILQSLGMTELGRGPDEPFLGHPSHYRRFAISRAERAG